MSLTDFDRACEDLVSGVHLCLEQRLITPALAVLYSGIDIMGWASSSPDESIRARFERWAKTYILPNGTFPCTETELYYARCGFVHSLGQNRDAHAKGVATVFYYWGSAAETARQLQSHADFADQFRFVCVDDLVRAFVAGIGTFHRDVHASPTLSAAVDSMAFFASMSNELTMEGLKFLDSQSPNRNLFEKEF